MGSLLCFPKNKSQNETRLCPLQRERGIDKLHNEVQPEVSVSLRFLDEAGTHHELTRIRKKTA